LAFCLGAAQGWQQQAGKDRNDGDHDQQLDQGKATGFKCEQMPFHAAFTFAPAAKCCLTASIFPFSAASRIERSGALAVGGSGGCDSPHPTSTTAAIVVSRRCFMSAKAQLNCVLFAIVLNVHMKIFMQYKKGHHAHA
jgi:hypothetical protein